MALDLHNKKTLPEIAKSGMIVGKLHTRIVVVFHEGKVWGEFNLTADERRVHHPASIELSH